MEHPSLNRFTLEMGLNGSSLGHAWSADCHTAGWHSFLCGGTGFDLRVAIPEQKNFKDKLQREITVQEYIKCSTWSLGLIYTNQLIHDVLYILLHYCVQHNK